MPQNNLEAKKNHPTNLRESTSKKKSLASRELDIGAKQLDQFKQQILANPQQFDDVSYLRLAHFKSALDNIDFLAPLTQLSSLDLSGCDCIEDITPLKHLTKLSSLNLNFCGHLQNIDALQYLSQLTSLNLHRCVCIQNDLSTLIRTIDYELS